MASSRLLTRAALVAGSLLLALLLAETVARVARARADRALFDEARYSADRAMPRGPVGLGDLICASSVPDLIYELRPGLDRVLYAGAPVSTNADGLRRRGETPRKGPNTLRILGLGDSVMFGQGVPDGREYLARLEEDLRRDDPSRDWQVLNAAVPGYDSAQEVAYLRARGLELEPDLVIVGFVSNDVGLPSFLYRPADVWSPTHSFLLEWLRGRAVPAWRRGLVPAPTQEGHAFRIEDDPDKVAPQWRHLVGWSAVERALDELAELSRSHGFEVLVFSHRPSEYSERALEAARARGLATCDLAPRLEAYMERHGIERYLGSELTVGPSDPHPSAIHHRLAAEELQRTLERLGLARAPDSER